MQTVTIHTAVAGTKLSKDGTSAAGHILYTLTNSSGVTVSYGYFTGRLVI